MKEQQELLNAAGDKDDTMSMEQAQEAISLKQDSQLNDSHMQHHVASFGHEEEEYGQMRQSPSVEMQGDSAEAIDRSSKDKKIHASQALVDGYASLDRV